MKQKPLLLRSELTGSVYIVTEYNVDRETGLVEAIVKHDVSDEFQVLASAYVEALADANDVVPGTCPECGVAPRALHLTTCVFHPDYEPSHG